MPKGHQRSELLALGSIALLFSIASLLWAGRIPFIGPVLVSLAPDFALLALILLTAWFALQITSRSISMLVLAPIALVFAMNTRLPALATDLVRTNWRVEKFGEVRRVPVSTPIRIIHEGVPLTGRRTAYASAAPACGEQCFVTTGFKMPAAWSSSQYWRENPETVLKDFGFVIARPDEPVDLLSIQSTTQGHFLHVTLSLRSAQGQETATARYTYRNGFSWEPKDDHREKTTPIPQWIIALNFLAHGSTPAKWFGRFVAPVQPEPLQHFLAANFSIPEANFGTFKLDGSKSSQVEPVRLATLELLEDKIYSPPLHFKGVNGQSVPDETWDAERYKYCDRLLRPENPGPNSQVWWLFNNDESGRRKMRRSSSELCDADTIWAFQNSRSGVNLRKFRANGELLYELTFNPTPGEPSFSGNLDKKSFHAKDGYIFFEWRDISSSGYDLTVHRDRVFRIKEPVKQ